MSTAVHRLHLTLDDQASNRYHEVPFEITHEESVEVTLAYDTGAAVVDLGCEDPDRWRGWSGGARSRFVITRHAATPGYEPGELPAGRWAVILGLHQLPAEGVDVELTVSTPAEGSVEIDPPAPPQPQVPRASTRGLPAVDGLTWYAGDFHAHTLHSDGDLSIDQIAEQAVRNGLDFMTLTEHNTVSHHKHLARSSAAYDLTILPGQEMTTHRGHANAFGDIGWIDFREPASRWVEEVAARGGLMSINHPLEGDCSWLHPLPELPLALELWHVGWFRDLSSTAPWALWPSWRHDAILLGGSDFHNHDHKYLPGTPTTWVAAEDRSPEALLRAVHAGRTAIAMLPGPGSPALLRVGDELLAVEADGAVLVDIEGRAAPVRGQKATFRADTAAGADAAGNGPYRLETAARHLLAISP